LQVLESIMIEGKQNFQGREVRWVPFCGDMVVILETMKEG